MTTDYSDLPAIELFKARDGSGLAYRIYLSARGPILILVHSSAWHGMQFHAMARHIAGRGLAMVVAPDMRRQDVNPARRDDLDHIGRLEMAAVINRVRNLKMKE